MTAALALSLGGLTPTALAAPISQAYMPLERKSNTAQAQAKGFIEGSSLTGSTRNWFAKEQLKRGARFSIDKGNGVKESSGSRDSWVQGTILDFSSGFTQGALGLSTEVAMYNAIALQRGKGRVAGGGNRTLTHRSNGEVVDQWSKLGLANIKARVANTTLTAGRQALNTPVLAAIGNRALPSSFQGIAVNSSEFDTLSVDLGSFDRVSPRTEQSLQKFSSAYGDRRFTADRVHIAGIQYQPLKSLTSSIYLSSVEDLWNQLYIGASHDLGDSSVLSLNTSFSYYKTRDAGLGKLGAIDNDTGSLAFTARHNAHSLTLAYQQVDGNEYFDYLRETNSIFLANSLVSDFNGPNEKSLQVGYTLDMAAFGVPGLKLNAYTARGWGIDGTHYQGSGYAGLQQMDGETHYEYGAGASYVIQDGPLKATSVRGTYSTHKASANQADGNLDELRLVTTIPFNIL